MLLDVELATLYKWCNVNKRCKKNPLALFTAAYLPNLSNIHDYPPFFARCNRETSGFAVTPQGKLDLLGEYYQDFAATPQDPKNSEQTLKS